MVEKTLGIKTEKQDSDTSVVKDTPMTPPDEMILEGEEKRKTKPAKSGVGS